MKIGPVQERMRKGSATKADIKLLKSRLAKQHLEDIVADMNLATPEPLQNPLALGATKKRGKIGKKGNKQTRPKAKRKNKKGKHVDYDSEESDSNQDQEGTELMGKTFVDDGETCTVTKLSYDSDDEAVAHYMFKGEEEYSSVQEMRAWVESYECKHKH